MLEVSEIHPASYVRNYYRGLANLQALNTSEHDTVRGIYTYWGPPETGKSIQLVVYALNHCASKPKVNGGMAFSWMTSTATF